jgi:hypothetical protein
LLRTFKRLGSNHRVGIAVVAIVLALAGPAESGAQRRDAQPPELQQLWREFPLDSSRGSTSSRSSRGRSIEPRGTVAPVARKVVTTPRPDASVRQQRALPVGQTPAESEDTPPTWSQIVFIVTLAAPIGIVALALRDVFVRRRRRTRSDSRRYALSVSPDAAPDTARSGNEPPSRDPGRAALLDIRASDARRGRPRKPNPMQSEVSKLKAKARPGPDPAKQLAAVGSEAEVIKSKPSSETEAEFLQKKSGSHVGLPHELDASTETGLLKEKLAAKKAISPAAPKPLPATTLHYRLGPKLRALPDLKTSKEPPAGPGRDLSQGAPLECEIRWPRGEARSQFVAVVTQPRGASREVASSPEFSWRKSEPPPETSDTAEALRVLVSGLVREGWTVAGRGDDWYAIRLAAEAQDRPEEASARKLDRSSERRPS